MPTSSRHCHVRTMAKPWLYRNKTLVGTLPGTSQQLQGLIPFHGYDSYLRPKVASNEQPLSRLQLPKSNKSPPKVYSPHSVAPQNNFPEFPSFSDGLSPNVELKRPPNLAHPPQTPGIEQMSTQSSQSCRAIRCSFMSDTCLWYLSFYWVNFMTTVDFAHIGIWGRRGSSQLLLEVTIRLAL